MKAVYSEHQAAALDYALTHDDIDWDQPLARELTKKQFSPSNTVCAVTWCVVEFDELIKSTGKARCFRIASVNTWIPRKLVIRVNDHNSTIVVLRDFAKQKQLPIKS